MTVTGVVANVNMTDDVCRFGIPVVVIMGGVEHTLWVNCSIYYRSEERFQKIAKAIKKGSRMTVIGTTNIAVYKDHRGEHKPALYLHVAHAVFLRMKADDDEVFLLKTKQKQKQQQQKRKISKTNKCIFFIYCYFDRLSI
jgi:single-stranded DNA-binding protein